MGGKLSTIVLAALSAIAALVFVLSLLGNHDPMLFYTYVLCAVALGMILWGFAMFIITQPAKLKGVGINVVVFGLVLVISYVLADGTVDGMDYPEGTTESTVKLSGMGLYMLYILFFGAVASIVYANVSKLLK